MSDEEDRKRTIRLNVRLNAETMSKVDMISSDLGVPPSTLGAIAIGEYVTKKIAEKQLLANVSVAAKETVEVMSQGMLEIFSNPETLAGIAASLEGASKRLEKD